MLLGRRHCRLAGVETRALRSTLPLATTSEGREAEAEAEADRRSIILARRSPPDQREMHAAGSPSRPFLAAADWPPAAEAGLCPCSAALSSGVPVNRLLQHVLCRRYARCCCTRGGPSTYSIPARIGSSVYRTQRRGRGRISVSVKGRAL